MVKKNIVLLAEGYSGETVQIDTEASESALNDLLSVVVEEGDGNATTIDIWYMSGGMRSCLSLQDVSRKSKKRMEKLKELLER